MSLHTGTYQRRRGEIEHYFDRTAMKAWEQLTSTAPVSRVRATVRAGRDRMRDTLLAWLPADLGGARVLDAGCGTGAFAIEAARRGARVLAIDLSPSLVDVARQRADELLGSSAERARIEFDSGDMSDARLGEFDHVVAMDSLIHYRTPDAVAVLRAMHAVGKLFPRGDRAPSIVPVPEMSLRREIAAQLGPDTWSVERTHTVRSGFYTSQAFELGRTC
jgi:magnesium-protoporphyrin O-methyltransferase